MTLVLSTISGNALDCQSPDRLLEQPRHIPRIYCHRGCFSPRGNRAAHNLILKGSHPEGDLNRQLASALSLVIPFAGHETCYENCDTGARAKHGDEPGRHSDPSAIGREAASKRLLGLRQDTPTQYGQRRANASPEFGSLPAILLAGHLCVVAQRRQSSETRQPVARCSPNHWRSQAGSHPFLT